MNDFVALDVETANADYSSICQIGLVEFKAGEIISEWKTLIDPEAYFDPYNTSVHGISQETVVGQPNFTDVFDELGTLLASKVVVHHGHFDFTAFQRCYDLHELAPISCAWLDNTKVVRRTWKEFSSKGYGLSNLAKHFDIELDHHDALSDAKAAGAIFLKALKTSGSSVDEWLEAVKRRAPVDPSAKDFRRDGDPDAPFFGEKIIFTGALSVNRQTAADVAQKLGFDVQNGVSKKTTFICVGIQDPRGLAGYSKSSKHRKAEALASEGHEISFLSEEDFWAIARIHSTGEIT